MVVHFFLCSVDGSLALGGVDSAPPPHLREGQRAAPPLDRVQRVRRVVLVQHCKLCIAFRHN